MRTALRRQGFALLLACLCAFLPLHAAGQSEAPSQADEDDAGQRGGVVINLPPTPSLPDTSGIVVVDVQEILEQSIAIRAVQDQLTVARQIFQAEMREREAGLQERDRVLAGQRASMDDATFQAERDRLARDLASLQEDIRVWFRAHDQAQNMALRQAQQTLLQIVSDLARQRGAAIVIPKSSIVLVQPSLDITEAAMNRLNRELPSLPPPVLPGGGDAPLPQEPND